MKIWDVPFAMSKAQPYSIALYIWFLSLSLNLYQFSYYPQIILFCKAGAQPQHLPYSHPHPCRSPSLVFFGHHSTAAQAHVCWQTWAQTWAAAESRLQHRPYCSPAVACGPTLQTAAALVHLCTRPWRCLAGYFPFIAISKLTDCEKG